MAKSRKDYIKVRLNGKTLMAVALYSALLMYLGACMRTCSDTMDSKAAKITNVRTR